MKIQVKTILLLVSILVIGIILPAIKPAIYLALAIHAFRGPKQTIEAFTVLFVILMGNPAAFGGSGKSLRWLVIISGFLSTIFQMTRRQKGNQTDENMLFIWFFFLAMLPIALLSSKIPSVSVFKLISFFMGAITIFHSFRTTRLQQEYWKNWFFTVFLFLLSASLLTFPLGIGFLRNGRGFQGIFNHPQTLGPICGIIASFFLGEYIFGKYKKQKVVLLLGSISVIFIFLSLARLGLVILGGGFLIAYLLSTLNGQRIIVPRFGQNVIIMFVTGILFLLIYDSESILKLASSFVQKRENTANIAEAFYESRGFLIEGSMQNFHQFPMLGIGFGVPTDFTLGFRNLETIMGIPIGASIEKGFFPSALLEEVGLIGTFLTILLIISIVKKVIRTRNFTLLWFVISVLLLNIGEAVFFSFGGLGLFDWLLLGFCYNQSY